MGFDFRVFDAVNRENKCVQIQSILETLVQSL